jgi:hypothetical protein
MLSENNNNFLGGHIMYMMYIFLSLVLLAILSIPIINAIIDNRDKKRYRKYLDSIKVGDVFLNEHKMSLKATNPFNKINEPDYHEVITEIKKNYRGITWVKFVDANKQSHEEDICTFVYGRRRVDVDVAGELMNK